MKIQSVRPETVRPGTVGSRKFFNNRIKKTGINFSFEDDAGVLFTNQLQ